MPGASGTPISRLISRSIRIDQNTDFETLTAGLDATPFQTAFWLKAWFSIWSKDEVQGFWVSVLDDDGRVLMAMPLIRYRRFGLRILEAVDKGVSDMNAPLLAPDMPENLSFETLWHCFEHALPDADVLHIQRMPAMVGAMENPLMVHGDKTQCRMHHWSVALPEAWEGYAARMSPSLKETLEKKRRRFERLDNPQSQVAQTGAEALDLMFHLEALQEQRIRSQGLKYNLADKNIKNFYRSLAYHGVEQGRVMICAMLLGDTPVALSYSYAHSDRMTYLRVTNRMGEWQKFQLGLLVTEFAIQQALERKNKVFDFSVGDYDYKKRFGGQPAPLYNLVVPLTMLGSCYKIAWKLRFFLSKVGFLRKIMEHLRQKT